MEVSVKTPPGVCLAHGPRWGGTLGAGDPGPRRARDRAAAELWRVRGEIRVPWVLAGSPQARRGGWDPGCGLLPPQPSLPPGSQALPLLSLHCPRGPGPLPAQGLSCRGFRPRVPVSRPGRWAWGMGAPHAVPGQTLPMHPVDTSRTLTTGPLSAVTNTPDSWGQVQGVPAFTGAPPQKLPQKRGSRVAAPAPRVRGGMQETPLEWARVQFCAGVVQTGSRRLWSLRHGGCPAPASPESLSLSPRPA